MRRFVVVCLAVSALPGRLGLVHGHGQAEGARPRPAASLLAGEWVANIAKSKRESEVFLTSRFSFSRKRKKQALPSFILRVF